MPLTDTFVRQVKPTSNPAGDKYTDGGGMYLLVKSSGKYWRMDYRFADKRKTLSIGVYPAVSLAKARKRREDARELLADEVDPSQAKRAQKQAVIAESVSTFKAVALEWHQMKSKGCVALVDALAHAYFQLVDTQYRTACMLTATVSCAVLRHFGMDAQLEPCQVWYSHPHHNYVIGFVGNAPQEGKWDGHLVCTSGKLLIDASLFHFNKEFGLEVPWVAAVQLIPVPSQMLARHELSDDSTLKWLYPPPGSDTRYPEVPQGLVQDLAGSLIKRLTPTIAG